jgi:NAD-dependent dihydropyrimidine dehydrogenase PreA subunit
MATPECRQAPGLFEPFIDRNRCEGKGACVAVCPHGVFTLGVLPATQRTGLSLKGQVKGWLHGWKQGFTPNAHACHACGQCVSACPEQAITLRRSSPLLRAMQNKAQDAPTAVDR